MTIELELQIATDDSSTLPHPSQFRDWISATLEDKIDCAEMTIRIVDEDEITDLNRQYRKQNKPTNVLSFPGKTNFEDLKFDESHLQEIEITKDYLGDIVICAQVMEKEANELEKDLIAHWAHIVVHGALHLLDFTHDTPENAQTMEGMETEIMVKLGFEPPYGDKINYE